MANKNKETRLRKTILGTRSEKEATKGDMGRMENWDRSIFLLRISAERGHVGAVWIHIMMRLATLISDRDQ